MLEIDGSRYSGSGAIVRHAVALAALTEMPIRIYNVRAKRPKPGLRRQHAQAVEAVCQLVEGAAEGAVTGAKEFIFRPGKPTARQNFLWDIGSAGSTTALALALLPVLAFRTTPASIELRGGVFQDFAPSLFHLQHVLLPLLQRMGFTAHVRLERPGYVPTGQGVWRLTATPAESTLDPLLLGHAGEVARMWGIALSSRLKEQSVSQRMADSANRVLEGAGYYADIEVVYDESALQAGASLALFADRIGGARIGADRAGAPGRPSERIGKYVARSLLEDLKSGATLDRHACDQIIPFAALAAGESRFLIPRVTDHVESAAWLSRDFLGARVEVDGHRLTIRGIGFRRRTG